MCTFFCLFSMRVLQTHCTESQLFVLLLKYLLLRLALAKVSFNFMKGAYNSPIYDDCKSQSAWVLTLSQKQAHQDDSNHTQQPICEFQVSFPLLRIRINQD